MFAQRRHRPLVPSRLLPAWVAGHGGQVAEPPCKVSFGVEVSVLPAAVERGRLRGGVVAQMKPAHAVHLRRRRAWSRGGRPPSRPTSHWLPRTRSSPDVATSLIGELVAGLAEDSPTLQLGIGQIPSVAAVWISARRNLRVWSELIGVGVLALDLAGALDPDNPVVTSFLLGSPPSEAGPTRTPACAGQDGSRQRSDTGRRSPEHALGQRCDAGRPFAQATRASSTSTSTRASEVSPTS